MKLPVLLILQTALLTANNSFLKVLSRNLPNFSWSSKYFNVLLIRNWHWTLATSTTFMASAIIWFFIIKGFELSQAVPLTASTYIFSQIFAALFFGETIKIAQWFGAVLITTGCFLVAL